MCDPCCGPCGPSCSPCDPCCSPFEPRGCRSRELRCGIMYTSCDCVKRNGLQDKCPRSMCQGRSACMSLPNPGCCPAAFPLRYANMTMGANRRRGGQCGPPPCGPCGEPCCGPSSPTFGAPTPIPCPPCPTCPALPETGVPDPRVWNCCSSPPVYPCGF